MPVKLCIRAEALGIEAHKRRTLHDPFSHIIGAICRRIRYQLPRAYRAALPSSNARVEQSARLPYAILPQHGDAPRMTATIALVDRSEEHTSELQSLMRISYAVFCLKKKTKPKPNITH